LQEHCTGQQALDGIGELESVCGKSLSDLGFAQPAFAGLVILGQGTIHRARANLEAARKAACRHSSRKTWYDSPLPLDVRVRCITVSAERSASAASRNSRSQSAERPGPAAPASSNDTQHEEESRRSGRRRSRSVESAPPVTPAQPRASSSGRGQLAAARPSALPPRPSSSDALSERTPEDVQRACRQAVKELAASKV